MIATAFTFFATQADRLILGRLISLTQLGIYGLAYQISDVPRAIILALGYRVAYPFIAKIIHQPIDDFNTTFQRYRFFALLVGALMLSIMVNWGRLLILYLYDPRYHEASWMIPILALGLWQTLLYQTTFPVLLSLGKAKYNAFGNAAYCLTIFAGIPIAFHFFGMVGAVIAVAGGEFSTLLCNLNSVLPVKASKLWRQDLNMTALFITIVIAFYFLKKI